MHMFYSLKLFCREQKSQIALHMILIPNASLPNDTSCASKLMANGSLECISPLSVEELCTMCYLVYNQENILLHLYVLP
jgi:hypothetical protein